MAHFKIYKARSGARFGILTGGATADYNVNDNGCYRSERKGASSDNRPWVQDASRANGYDPAICLSFRAVRVSADVTRIGDNFFKFFEHAKFAFEDSDKLVHIGENAFAQSGVGGRLSLGGLTQLSQAAFQGCTQLEEVFIGARLTKIGGSAFTMCHRLRAVRGCENIEVIATGAFTRCASLAQVDAKKDRLTCIGTAAFHATSIGSLFDHFDREVFVTASGNKTHSAVRRLKFDADTLAELQRVILSDCGMLPETTHEQNYPDMPYGMQNGVQDYLHNGCRQLSVYHVYRKLFPDSAYTDFPSFWSEVRRRYSAANGGAELTQQERGWDTLYSHVIDLMGMQCMTFEGNASVASAPYMLHADGTEGKRVIAEALENGYGVLAEISTGTYRVLAENQNWYGKQFEAGDVYFDNSHQVAIVGARHGKLMVVDSAYIDGDKAGCYELAYEDLFIGKQGANVIYVLMPKEERHDQS